MTITQLAYVVALNAHRNFAAAAAHCHVTQPTLSMQLKKLEEELGAVLFDRNKKPVAPTDIGEKVIEQARVSLQSLKQIDALVRHHASDLSGTLRVGIVPTLSPYLLPRILPSLAQRYPSLTLEIEELLSDQIVDKLHKDQLDVALWVARASENHLIHVPLFYERFLVYLPNGHAHAHNTVSLSELDMKQLWLLKEGHCFRDQVVSFCGELLETNHHASFLSGSLETLKKIVDQHYGFTLLPELAVLDLPPEQRANVRSFKNISPLRAVSITYHQRFCKHKLIQMLKTEIQANVPRELLERNPRTGGSLEISAVLRETLIIAYFGPIRFLTSQSTHSFMKKFFFTLAVPVLSFLFVQCQGPSATNVQPAELFTDNAVLQRGQEIVIWGTADPGGKIEVELAENEAQAEADAQGKWQATLPAMEAGGPYELEIEGADEIALKNIMIGDVWLASGQSNMEWALQAEVDNFEEEIANANYPNIRLFTVERTISYTPLDSMTVTEGGWLPCSPETVPAFSAVAYFFGRQIHQEEGVAIGLINSSWGGTPAEAWTSEEMLLTMPDFAGEIKKRQQANETMISPEAIEQQRSAIIETANQKVSGANYQPELEPECRKDHVTPEPLGSCRHHPAKLRWLRLVSEDHHPAKSLRGESPYAAPGSHRR